MMPYVEFCKLPYEEKISALRKQYIEDGQWKFLCLLGFLEQYSPRIPASPSPDNQDSQDIRESLEYIWEYSVQEISEMMFLLGYDLYFADVSRPVWAMDIRFA